MNFYPQNLLYFVAQEYLPGCPTSSPTPCTLTSLADCYLTLTAMSDVSYLSHARYGKDKVRVFRIVREGAAHRVVEYNVTALVEGDIDAR